MLIIDKLSNNESLSDTEVSIASFILAQGKDIESVSTRQLAEATYVSPATIIRFCKKLQFAGFDDMKRQFIRKLDYLDSQFGTVDVNFPFGPDDKPMKVANKIADLYMDTVKDTLSLQRSKDLKNALFLLKNHRSVHVFSYGTMLNAAESFREKMLKIEKPVYLSNNLNYQIYHAASLGPQDLVILISYSGETEKILLIAQRCKQQKTPILALTSFGENSLSKIADCVLPLSTKESMIHNLGDYSSHISAMYTLDLLYSLYFNLHWKENYEKKIRNARTYESRRKSSNAILNVTEETLFHEEAE